MGTPYTYPQLTQPRQIRLLKVRIDPHFAKTVGDFLQSLEDAAHQKQSQSLTVPDPDPDQEAAQRLEKFVKEPRIDIEFIETSLDSPCSSYTAISYAWGSSQQTQQVGIQGGLYYLKVPASTISVLIHLARWGVNDRIWIDALCINQGDIREKSQQVCYMYDVYRNAERALVWAGESCKYSQSAMDFVSELGLEMQALDAEGTPLTVINLTKRTGFHSPSTKWTALARFLCRPLFRRIWILQEMIAARSKRLMCGASEVDWNRFSCVVRRLVDSGCHVLLKLPDKSEHNDAVAGAKALGSLLELHFVACYPLDFRPPSSFRLPFSFVLGQSDHFCSTDPRDRIFALRNISDVGEHELVPDYGKSVETVYQEATVHLMKQTGQEFFGLYSAGIGYRRKLTTLPSWVADWSRRTGAMSFGCSTDSTMLFEHKKDFFYACGKNFTLGAKPESLCPGSIRCKGRILDCVRSHHSSRPNVATDSEHNMFPVLAWLVSLCRFLEPNYAYPNEAKLVIPDILATTLVAGDVYEIEFGPTAAEPDFVNYFAVLFAENYKIRSEVMSYVPFTVQARALRIVCQEVMLEGSSALANAAFEAAQRYDRSVLKNRRLFTTDRKYIGLGPLLMQEGDVVCLLYGAKVPFLIRARDRGGYELVGECYIHGLMHGEGISMGKEQDITLY